MLITTTDSLVVIRCTQHPTFTRTYRAGSDGTMPISWLTTTITRHHADPNPGHTGAGSPLDTFGRRTVQLCLTTIRTARQEPDPSWPLRDRLAVAVCLDLNEYLAAGWDGQPGLTRETAATRLRLSMDPPPTMAALWAWVDAVVAQAYQHEKQERLWRAGLGRPDGGRRS